MEEKEMNSQDIDSKKREAIDGQIAEDGEKTGIDRNVNRQCAMAREMARQIALLVEKEGGRAFFVGGCVRDKIAGIANKDIDIEVHGLKPEKLEQILGQVGRWKTMGTSFGIYSMIGCHLDIAMPRTERTTGRGHRDFRVFVDPYLGPEAAARRRDFTVNALMEDVLTGKIFDAFGGRRDLERGILRHVDEKTFAEDPLRVLRGAQFAARFDFSIADETVELCKTMDLSALPGERVEGELEKAFLKAEHPSGFFLALRRMEQLGVWFPEIAALIGVEQNPDYHPEGDVWNHTMMVLDEAAALREEARDTMGFMMAALVHDLGKTLTTEQVNGKIHAFQHETKGLPLVENFLERLVFPKKRIGYVTNMVELHMKPNAMAARRSGVKSTNRLFDRSVDPKGLILLARADHLGRPGATILEENETFLWERLALFYEMMERPYVKGEDLIASGILPGPEFSELLTYAHKLRLAVVEKEAALKQVLGMARGMVRRRGKNDESE